MQRAFWQLLDPAIVPRDGDYSGYLHDVLNLCVTVFRASGGSLFVKSTPDVFTVACSCGAQRELPPHATVRRGEGVAGLCLVEDRPMRINNPSRERSMAGKVAVRSDLASALVIPLTLPDGRQVGLLNLSRERGQRTFLARDLDRASRVGSQIALVIGNAQLVSEARQSRNELEVLFSRLPYAIWLFDRAGNLRECNATACAIGTSLPTSWGVTEGLGNWDVRDLDSGKWWRVTRLPAGEANLVTAEDITEAKGRAREEARLRRLAEIGQLTATLAHEIRNPLTGIRTAAQMIGSCPEQQEEFAGIIQEEADKLNELCNDLLEFARPMSLKIEEVSLTSLAKRVAELEAMPLQSRGIALELAAAPPDLSIPVDPMRVEQVIRNLVLNAADACPEGGQIRVEVEARELRVVDNGHGMDRPTQERLFTPFFTTKAKGTGLGLSYARKVVEAHGGVIAVQSEVGQGTVVSVSFQEAA